MEKAVERSVAPTSGGGYSPDFRVAVSRWKLSVRGQRSATPASPQPVSHPAWRNHPPQTATRRFKRQFFGQKSERRIGIGTGGRMSRDEWLTQPTRPEPQGRVMAAPTRKPATRRHGDEAVPFFDETRIPVDVIELPAPEIDGLAPEDYELIRHQENSRLALRAIPVGRRNGLFCWTELGARHVGILQSWIVTCRLHQIDPCDYPVDVLQRLGQPPANRVHELTPRMWKKNFATHPLRSPIHRLGKYRLTPRGYRLRRREIDPAAITFSDDGHQLRTHAPGLAFLANVVVVTGTSDNRQRNAARLPAVVPSFAPSASFGLPTFTVNR